MGYARLPRTIRIKAGLSGVRLLDVLIHELLHAALWDLGEDAVNETAEDIAKALYKIGYRRVGKALRSARVSDRAKQRRTK